MPTKLEDTARRIVKREYEKRNKEERKQKSGNFQAMMPRSAYNEINEFLKKNKITKVQLVIEGYNSLKAKQGDK